MCQNLLTFSGVCSPRPRADPQKGLWSCSGGTVRAERPQSSRTPLTPRSRCRVESRLLWLEARFAQLDCSLQTLEHEFDLRAEMLREDLGRDVPGAGTAR